MVNKVFNVPANLDNNQTEFLT